MNITYELALQLKEAGFPQIYEGAYDYFMEDKEHTVYRIFHESESEFSLVMRPTLSELIDALGDHEYFELRHRGNLWMADIQKGKPKILICGDGSTPEIACARLYLALQQHT